MILGTFDLHVFQVNWLKSTKKYTNYRLKPILLASRDQVPGLTNLVLIL